MKKYNFVYKTTNNINGDYYYGVHSTDNFNDGYIGSGSRLKNSVNKYGKENFTREIVQFFSRSNCAYSLERAIVTPELINDEHCLNIAVGGYGSNTLYGKTEQELNELKQRMQAVYSSSEFSKKMSEAAIKRWQDPEYREFWTKNMTENNPAKRDDVKQKISKSMTQYYIDHPEARQQLSENNPAKREDVRQKMRHPHNMSEEGSKRLSAGGEKRRGKNNGAYGKRYKWMNDGTRNYRIDLDKIEYNLSQGLKIGYIQNREQ